MLFGISIVSEGKLPQNIKHTNNYPVKASKSYEYRVIFPDHGLYSQVDLP